LLPVASKTSKAVRDGLLDQWRGIALIDMAWVHLASHPIGMPAAAAAWIGDYTRFAAGMFVLLSGLSVRRVFGRRLETGGTAARFARHRLVRRSLLLALVDRTVCVAYGLIEQLVDDPSWIPAIQWEPLLPVATFRHAGVTGGLLALYALLLVLVPAIESLRRHAGSAATMAVSLACFGAAQFLGAPAHWPPWTFPLLHWQPLFVAGYLVSPAVDSLRASRQRTPGILLLAASAAFVVMFAIRNPEVVGIDPSHVPSFDFSKVPLRPAELGWYVVASAFVMAWAGWLRPRGVVARSIWRRFESLGRWSLLVYVSHLLLELPILAFLTLLDPSPSMRAMMLPAIAAAMVGVAAAADHLRGRRTRRAEGVRARPAVHLVPPAGLVGGTLAASCATAVLVMQATISAAPPRYSPGSESPVEAEDAPLELEDAIEMVPAWIWMEDVSPLPQPDGEQLPDAEPEESLFEGIPDVFPDVEDRVPSPD
jgi:hypothetical protein